MQIETLLNAEIKKAIHSLFQADVNDNLIQLQKTRKEFEGDVTLVTFPLLKVSKSSPEKTGEIIGEYLKEKVVEITDFNVIKGFLNLSISDKYWSTFFNSVYASKIYGFASDASGKTILLEYSSPNTNKPLHLGHIRNNLLGYSVAEILKANGHDVKKVNLVNDRGIHICKSMLAWKKMGNGETPQSSGIKGDHLVGKYYVEFDKMYKAEIKSLMEAGKSKEEAEKNAPIILEAQEMLRKWEAGDKEVVDLWKAMNGWVYDGFDVTYKKLGVDFDKFYYESETYLLGKKAVEIGLQKNVFYKKEDGSVWCDLTADGLDQKLLLRSDGTSVYMTQDIGTAIQRSEDFPSTNQMIYTVGNEQEYHFKVLFLILSKLGYDWAKECYHLSYGMVELPEGKMKSREGTVVDADDLIDEMVKTAKATSEELGKLDDCSEEEKEKLYQTIGMGALKYFILKVDPRKGMLFNPAESIDFNGNTGPFIQYTHARIQSLLRKADFSIDEVNLGDYTFDASEKEIIKLIYDYPEIVKQAGNEYSPSLIANYTYELVKAYNHFYQALPIFKEENEEVKKFRLQLSKKVAAIIQQSLALLGIQAPDRM
jgi:arginyl-tRNA synthetase